MQNFHYSSGLFRRTVISPRQPTTLDQYVAFPAAIQMPGTILICRVPENGDPGEISAMFQCR